MLALLVFDPYCIACQTPDLRLVQVLRVQRGFAVALSLNVAVDACRGLAHQALFGQATWLSSARAFLGPHTLILNHNIAPFLDHKIIPQVVPPLWGGWRPRGSLRDPEVHALPGVLLRCHI